MLFMYVLRNVTFLREFAMHTTPPCRSATVAWTSPLLVSPLFGRLYFQSYRIRESTSVTGAVLPDLDLGLLPVSMQVASR